MAESSVSRTRWDVIAAWSLDFVRALHERPLWARLLFRVALGRYAYREFIGLVNALDQEELGPYFDYGLEGMDYHHDRIPAWRWWERR